jgi:hypothetical protein
MWKEKSDTKLWLEILIGRGHLGDLGIDEGMILKSILKEGW